MSSSPTAPDPGAETNPYAAPRAELGASAVEFGGALTEAEAIRRANLGHEASVRSIGTLHYLVASLGVLFIIALIVLIAMTLIEGGVGPRGDLFILILVLGIYSVTTGLNFALGFGLRRLQPWARWTETALVGIGLVFSLSSVFGVVAGLKNGGPGAGIGFGLGILLYAYLLYLLLSPKGATVFSPTYRVIIEETPHIRYQTSLLVKIVVGVLFAVIMVGLAGGIVAFLFDQART